MTWLKPSKFVKEKGNNFAPLLRLLRKAFGSFSFIHYTVLRHLVILWRVVLCQLDTSESYLGRGISGCHQLSLR